MAPPTRKAIKKITFTKKKSEDKDKKVRNRDANYYKSDELTPKQESFCKNYVSNGFNVMKACREAGYRSKDTGYMLMRLPKILTQIQKLRDLKDMGPNAVVEGSGEGSTSKRILQELINLGLADITKVCRWGKDFMETFSSDTIPPEVASCIKKVDFQEVEFTGKTPKIVRKVSVEMHEKKGALDSAARALGMFEQTGRQDPSEIADKLRNILDVASAGSALPTMQLPTMSQVATAQQEEEGESPISNVVKH